MATNFPNSVDNLTNPTTSDTLATVSHSGQHTDANDAIEAIQTALLDGAPLKIDDANERVGIGTTSPNEALDVQGNISQGASGSNAGRLLIDNTTDTVQRIKVSRGGSTGQLAFHTGSDTEHVRITNSGNVGINDTTPSYTLDVNGDINSQTDVLVGGNSLPRGLVAINSYAATQTLTTTIGAYLSVTFDAVAGRNYLIDSYIWMYGASTNQIAVGRIYWGSTRIQELNLDITSADSRRSLHQNVNYVPSSSGSVTVQFRAFVTAGTAGIAANSEYPNQLKIYDMGEA